MKAEWGKKGRIKKERKKEIGEGWEKRKRRDGEEGGIKNKKRKREKKK